MLFIKWLASWHGDCYGDLGRVIKARDCLKSDAMKKVMKDFCLILGLVCGLALSPLSRAAEEGAPPVAPQTESKAATEEDKAAAEKEKKEPSGEKREGEKKNQEPSCDN
jgi:hypothetical protein